MFSINPQQTSLLLGQKIQIAPSIEQDYNQNTTGATVFASYPLRKFSFTRLGVTYGYSDTSIQAFSTSSTDLFQVLQFQSLAGPSALERNSSRARSRRRLLQHRQQSRQSDDGQVVLLFLQLGGAGRQCAGHHQCL